MTTDDYRQLCDAVAREAIRYAAEFVAEFERWSEAPPDDLETKSEHWLSVYLDEHLPVIAPSTLLAVTSHADAFEKAAGRPAPSIEIAAVHAFQADVWDAINRTEQS